VAGAVRAHQEFLAAETLATAVAFGDVEGFTGEVGDGEPVTVAVTRAV
jgi:isoleucyl-tRNA synthetase